MYPRSIVLLLGLLVIGCAPTMPPTIAHPLVGNAPDSARRPTMTGELVSVPAEGKVTIVEFWSTSCAPCLEQMPHLERLWQERGAEGLVVLGVATESDTTRIRTTLAERGVTYPVVVDDGSVLQGRYRVDDLPRTFVLDRAGKVRYFADSTVPDASERVREAAEYLLAH